MLAANPRIRDLAMTTNGVLFAEHAEELRAAGLHRVTLSLDTLRPERFLALTGRDAHAQVLAGISARARWVLGSSSSIQSCCVASMTTNLPT